MTAPSTLVSFADELCRRVNRRGVGRWLEEFGRRTSREPQQVLPVPPVGRHVMSLPQHGLYLVLRHPHAGDVEHGDPDRWLITDVLFDVAGVHGAPWRQALPFRLDARLDTPALAEERLDANSLGLGEGALRMGDYRQSFVLEGGLVLEITWLEQLHGISQVTVVRLGTELLEPVETT